MNIEKSFEQWHPNIQTQKEKIDWAPFAFQYKFEFPNSTDKKGDAQLFFQSLDDLVGSDKNNKIAIVLSKRGIEPSDIISHLNEFYPNGRALDEKKGEHMREGVGTVVLNQLIDEARANGAKVIYVFTGKESMVNFLKKHGFERLDAEEKYRFFKIIEGGKNFTSDNTE
jgi:hypothetical protein